MNLNKQQKIIYTAALLEGEGHIGSRVTYENRSVRIKCSMTDEDIINRLLSWWGGNKYTNEDGRKEDYKTMYTWVLRPKDKVEFLCNKIYKYMGNRRKKQINHVLEVCNSLTEKQKERAKFYKRVKEEFSNWSGTQKDFWNSLDTDKTYSHINNIINGKYDEHIDKFYG